MFGCAGSENIARSYSQKLFKNYFKSFDSCTRCVLCPYNINSTPLMLTNFVIHLNFIIGQFGIVFVVSFQ